MTVTTEVDLQKSYTSEEHEAMLEAYYTALESNNEDEADRLLVQIPILPRWAKYILEIYGKEFLLENFNITDANKEYGEDWLDG